MSKPLIEKGYFFFELSDTEVLDLADMTPKQWREIERRSKVILASFQTENAKIAFVAAFMHYMMELQNMRKPFNIDA